MDVGKKRNNTEFYLNNIEKSREINFTLLQDDLIVAMRKELDFLVEVEKFPLLNRAGPVLNNAIRRYETLFLPTVVHYTDDAFSTLYAAPLDIQWIWHCHMLAPVSYSSDCMRLIGKVPNHSLKYYQKPYGANQAIKKLWDKHISTNEPYEVSLTEETPFLGGPDYEQKCSYDLQAAVLRQAQFYYNVSLPHYQDYQFLTNAVARYKMMLALKLMNPQAIVVPCYDIDLAWHTHLLHPSQYESDCHVIFQKTFNHDDTLDDRREGSKLSVSMDSTKKLWKEAYGQHLALSGAMYRGPSPVGKLHAMTEHELRQICELRVRVQLREVTIPEFDERKAVLQIEHVRKEICEEYWKRNESSGDYPVFTDIESIELTTDNLHNEKDLKFTVLRRVKSGFSAKNKFLGGGIYNLDHLVARDVDRDKEINDQLSITNTSIPIHIKGSASLPNPYKASLKLHTSPFENVVMPETIESMWGPIPLQQLPKGVKNHCTVASHSLKTNRGSSTLAFTVRVIHCIPLMMSCVQVYYEDKMTAVAHLVGLDQIPDSSHPHLCKIDSKVHFRKDAGERAMLIKDASGDKMVVFARWANMSRATRGRPNSPGNLEITLFNKVDNGEWNRKLVDSDVTTSFQLPEKLYTNLGTGLIEVQDTDNICNYIALTFSIGVLRCLCQPPPPKEVLKINHAKLGPLNTPKEYNPIQVGIPRGFKYNDCTHFQILKGSGWGMPIPSNSYLRFQAIKKKKSKSRSTQEQRRRTSPVDSGDDDDDDDGDDDDDDDGDVGDEDKDETTDPDDANDSYTSDDSDELFAVNVDLMAGSGFDGSYVNERGSIEQLEGYDEPLSGGDSACGGNDTGFGGYDYAGATTVVDDYSSAAGGYDSGGYSGGGYDFSSSGGGGCGGGGGGGCGGGDD